MADTEPADPTSVDRALADWRQGDCVLGEQWFVHRAAPDTTGEAGLQETPVAGLVVVTQTCDVVSSAGEVGARGLEVVLNKLKQANLLFDAEAWEQIRKTNDQVKAQGKHDPEVLVMFKPLLDFFARGPRPSPSVPAPAATAPA